MLVPGLLIALSLSMSVGLLLAVRRAAPQRLASVVAGVVVWLGVTAALGTGDVLSFSGLPPTMPILLVGLTFGTVVFARSETGRLLATRVPLAVLVGYQAFRILVELWLHQAYTEGLIPVQMTYAGLNFDILTGVTALVVAALLAKGVVGRRTVLVWNVLGLVLLTTIVSIALLSAPTPLRLFADGPGSDYVIGFPGVWLPAILVQMALLGHLLVLRRLWKGDR